jgi:stringent starvation protein B
VDHECGHTPHVIVDAERDGTAARLRQEDRIVLNLSEAPRSGAHRQ